MFSEHLGDSDGKKKKILVNSSSWDRFSGTFFGDTNLWSYELIGDTVTALAKMSEGHYDAFLIDDEFFKKLFLESRLNKEKSILEKLTSGLVLVDNEQRIIWYNRQFRQWSDTDELIGEKFYMPLGRPELRGPDFCPFRTIRMTKKPSQTTLYQQRPARFLSMNTTPILTESGEIEHFLVELQDITAQSKEEVIALRLRDAGRELADLSKDDILNLSSEERINILRAKIAKYAKEILQFDTIEIRLLSHRIPLLLEPLLAIGMAEAAKQRTLYALQEKNGITGWVAYHGKSYLMEDPTEDIFYIEGIPGARSSITVPLLRHGKVIGTFNVESQKPKAFTESDLHLLESYAVDVAAAIHTLDLLSFENKDSAFRSYRTVWVDTAATLNHILNECARLLDEGMETLEERTAAINGIQSDVRSIQETIIGLGGEIATDLPPEESETDCRNFQILRGKRILTVDADSTAGTQLSRVLFFYGCTVETAQDGTDALRMLETTRYDAIISCVKLKDMSAYTFYEQVRDMLRLVFVPFIFMTGYGHDGEHVMTRAREAGVLGYVYKPFKLPQLLKNLKVVMSEAERLNR